MAPLTNKHTILTKTAQI